MRPFRFFFAASLGLILFFFLAKFVVLAMVLAAVMSLVFFLGRRIRNFFQRLDWQEAHRYDDHFPENVRSLNRRPKWKGDMLMDYPSAHRRSYSDYRVIKIR